MFENIKNIARNIINGIKKLFSTPKLSEEDENDMRTW